jgi:hypothetical protein
LLFSPTYTDLRGEVAGKYQFRISAMTRQKTFEQLLSSADRARVEQLTSPSAIQQFLDKLDYSTEAIYRCPLQVVCERTAHCFDGALFAAAMLRRLGYPPLILEMLPNDRDDDHLLAVYQRDGCWGALAKSNFVGLRAREPVYRNLRELVMSYFEQYYNVEGERTLRGYTLPLHLAAFDRHNWMCRQEPLDDIADRLDQIRRVALLTPTAIDNLTRIDERSRLAGLYGATPDGLYQMNSDSL